MAPMEDRISALPDSLICHILSFLPTEQAVATSLLSKRWRPMWLAVPTLNFDDRSYLRNQDMYSRFIRLVYAVMLSRGEEPPIKEFRLKCWSSSKCDPSAVNVWVRAAIRCKVEHIYLSLHVCIRLQFSLFSSTLLVVLKLSWFSVQNIHSSVSFPSLKVLDLKCLCFQEHRCLFEIISGCPVLEVLVMKSVTFTDPFTHGQSKHFQLPKLVKADISNSTICLPLKPFYNVQFLRIDVMMEVELPTHNLINLTYMELSFFYYSWDWLIKLLCYCPNLQSLVIDQRKDLGLFRSSDDKNWVHPQCVPKCLFSQLIAFSVKNYEGEEKEFQLIKYIMQNARVLCDVTVCCTGYSKLEDKFQMLEKLSLCRRGSDLCQLHFG